MAVRVGSVDAYVTNLETRLPFGFGSVTLERFPHVVVEASVEIDGRNRTGVAADNVVPKWFVKRDDQTVSDDVTETVEMVDVACRFGGDEEGATPFDVWHGLYRRMASWADDACHPPLLWGFGVSLVERAVIDAWCRARGESFHEAVRDGSLGIDLAAFYPELAGRTPAEFLPERPREVVAVRHTVGHADPLTPDDVAPEDRRSDELPRSLQEYLRRDGVRYLKVKLVGTIGADLQRLRDIVSIVERNAPSEVAYTVDANEQYRDVAQLRELWSAVRTDPDLAALTEHLRFVEQPFSRDVAFTPDTATALRDWEDRPPIIVDESDAEMDSLATALDSGYDGTSHKNCKGVFGGIANACLLNHRRRRYPGRDYVLSGEDLTTVGPVSLLQDLAVAATLGLDHVERNGHHYFRGLEMFPEAINERMLTSHGDLYRRLDDTVAALDVKAGEIRLGSVLDAPFGVGVDVDVEPTRFRPLSEWRVDSLDG